MTVSWVFHGSGKTALDDETRKATEYTIEGEQLEVRDFTDEEDARADQAIEEEAARLAAQQLASDTQALVEATKELAPPPTTGGAWAQPTGATDAYAQDSVVTHNGKTWKSLTPFNVWEPGVAGWREEVAQGYPAWVQPVGAVDAYPLNAKVTHKGSNWENTGSAANVWEPGVFGWIVIT